MCPPYEPIRPSVDNLGTGTTDKCATLAIRFLSCWLVASGNSFSFALQSATHFDIQPFFLGLKACSAINSLNCTSLSTTLRFIKLIDGVSTFSIRNHFSTMTQPQIDPSQI